ncbi:MAG: exosortase C-terminal domain/associated protein EpsI [Nitrospirota bacterium]
MIKNSRFIIVYLLIIITGLYINLHSDIAVPINRPFSEFPINNQDWRMISQSVFSERELKILKPTDYIYRDYLCPDDSHVQIYIGYHDGGKDGGGIHSPKHCLPGSGWYRILEKEISIDAGGKRVDLMKAVYQKGEEKTLFLYWYQVKGRSLSDEYSLKLSEILNSIFYRRRDSAFIRVSMPFEADEEKAFSVGVKFIKDFYPIIQEFLPK